MNDWIGKRVATETRVGRFDGWLEAGLFDYNRFENR